MTLKPYIRAHHRLILIFAIQNPKKYRIVKFKADENGILNVYLDVGLNIDRLSLLEYISILSGRYENDPSVQDEIQRQIQFKQVVSRFEILKS